MLCIILRRALRIGGVMMSGWVIGGVVELPLTISTAKAVEELAGSLAHAFGFGFEVCDGGTDRWLHGRVACLAPLDRRL